MSGFDSMPIREVTMMSQFCISFDSMADPQRKSLRGLRVLGWLVLDYTT